MAEETLAGLRSAGHVHLPERVLALREQARRGLRVMKALAATWHRDLAERQERRNQWESEIQQRYERYRKQRR
ncbi:hypothetical protein [Sphingomonas sp. CCH9-F2]|uniref:hypothetical protein n=1 Tax=Sphingomonas sp. CCH9-F2 TaxID=1768778 RepID=UPI0018D2697C|nr:hypothetical protein [Sphingomonas sp. CCH9-F2]